MRWPLFDAVIIGAGPAGSAAGRLLAQWGHRVAVIARDGRGPSRAAESLPPSIGKLLTTLGAHDDIARAAFPRNAGNVVFWGAEEPRVESFEGGARGDGYLVVRPVFDRVLRSGLHRAGAIELAGTVTSVTFTDGLATVDYGRGGRRSSVRARYVLDCSGRSGVLARQGLRRYEPDQRMQAISGLWESDAEWPVEHRTRTCIETYADGWAWSVPTSSRARHVTAMVDATTARSVHARSLEVVHRAEVAKTRHLRTLLADASLRQVWACDASVYSARAYAGDSFLLVGDAGSFIDPLSSSGVKKALASGWLAAVSTNTALRRDENGRVPAFEFFDRWERSVYASHLRQTGEFARQAYACHGHRFWAARIPRSTDAEHEPADPERRAAVRRAFEVIRSRRIIRFRRNDRIAPVPQPVVRNNEIVLEPAVPLPSEGGPMRYLEGVDMVGLRDLAPDHAGVAGLYDAYCGRFAPVALPAFLTGLSTLMANELIEERHS